MRIAIIGGGIAGLTAAFELARLAHDGTPIEAVLFESSSRLGGLIETVREGGFTVECGPDGWVSAKPWARELAVELGLTNELISSNDATRKTWIYLDHNLVAMPDGLNMMVPTRLAALDDCPLFTSAAIAAYRAEPARAAELLASIPGHDESIADFTLRHFGPEVLARVAAPLLSGVFGGEVHNLSVRAVMPAFVQMERNRGSLIAALQAAAHTQPANAPPDIFTTLRPGLGILVERLVANIPPPWLRRNSTVTALQTTASPRPSWTVFTSASGKRASEPFDAVLLATPVRAARSLLSPLLPAAGHLLPMESSSAVLVAFCFAEAASVPLPPGFGFLVPPTLSTERPGGGPNPDSEIRVPPTLLLACTFTDQKFPHRVPAGGRQIRAYFGGAAADRVARCNNDEVAAIARLELARILNTHNHSHAPLTGPAPTPLPAPVLTVIRRWPNSLPQYAVGHLDRAAELESHLAQQLPGLTLLGNALHGVGLPDLIRDARKAARAASLSTHN